MNWTWWYDWFCRLLARALCVRLTPLFSTGADLAGAGCLKCERLLKLYDVGIATCTWRGAALNLKTPPSPRSNDKRTIRVVHMHRHMPNNKHQLSSIKNSVSKGGIFLSRSFSPHPTWPKARICLPQRPTSQVAYAKLHSVGFLRHLRLKPLVQIEAFRNLNFTAKMIHSHKHPVCLRSPRAHSQKTCVLAANFGR